MLIMLKVTFVALLLVFMFLGDVDVLAQTTSKQKNQECISLINERTAALVADDWQHLERLAKRYLQTCRSVHDPESLANAQEDLAIAYLKLGNLTAALLATESCIDLFYASAGCHVRWTELLLKLERPQEARASLAIAEKLVGYLITTTEKNLQRAAHPLERDLNAAKLEKLRALEYRISTLRPQVNQ